MDTADCILGGFAVTTTAVAAGVWAMIQPTNGFYGKVHWRGCGNVGSRYALTFDDGPTEPSTPAVLDALGELGATATFFVVGQNARKHPRLLERMHADGHLIANHSYDHPHFGMLRGPIYWRRQIDETDCLIEQIIGLRPAFFRPPMGVRSWFICGSARRSGHATVMWSRRGLDGTATTPQAILDRLLPRTIVGDVLLMHDGVESHSRRDPSASVAAVRPLITGLRSRGLEPMPLDAMLQLPAYQLPQTSVAAPQAAGTGR